MSTTPGRLLELDDAEIIAAVDRAIAALAEPRQLLEDIGAALEQNADLRFDAKVDPTGAPWAPLARNTVEYWYAKKYPEGIPGSLLERSRKLRDTLTYNVGDDWLEIGTSRAVPGKSQPEWQVGLLHEFGTAKMPRRGILTADPKRGELGRQDREDVLDVISQALGDAFTAR